MRDRERKNFDAVVKRFEGILQSTKITQQEGETMGQFVTIKNRCFSGTDAGVPRRPEKGDAATLMEIGTRDIFSEEHDIFRQSTRKFFQELAPRHLEWEKQGFVDDETWRRVGQQGLLGIQIPEEFGGQGAGFLTESILAEELLLAMNTSTGFLMSSTICAPYIVRLGTKEQIEKFIPRIVQGECRVGAGMTEPGAGSDMQGFRTNAKKDGDDWILNGTKTFITNGYCGHLFIIVANTNRDAKTPAHGFSLFLVESGTKGFTKGKLLEKMGTKSSDTCELFFDDVRLPKEALLGQVNHGFSYLMQNLPLERIVIGVGALALGDMMFETTRTYVKERKAFGRTLSALQTIQHKLAEMKTELVVTQAFIDQCIVLQDEHRLSSSMASMAKYWGSDLAKKVADQCVQLHGGWGYMNEMPISRAFTAARLYSIYGGTNEIMKELIAREIVKK